MVRGNISSSLSCGSLGAKVVLNGHSTPLKDTLCGVLEEGAARWMWLAQTLGDKRYLPLPTSLPPPTSIAHAQITAWMSDARETAIWRNCVMTLWGGERASRSTRASMR